MCVVVRLAQGGRLAWLSRFHSQGREEKVGVGSEGRGSGVPGGRRENRVWVGALRLGAGYIHCTSSTAEESQTFHNDPLYLLYLNPTLQPLSHTLKDLSSVVVSGRLEAKQDNHNALIECEWKTGIQVQYVQGNITAATTSRSLKVYFNLLTNPAFFITVITSVANANLLHKESSNFACDSFMCRQSILWPDEFLSLYIVEYL